MSSTRRGIDDLTKAWPTRWEFPCGPDRAQLILPPQPLERCVAQLAGRGPASIDDLGTELGLRPDPFLCSSLFSGDRQGPPRLDRLKNLVGIDARDQRGEREFTVRRRATTAPIAQATK